MFINTNVHGYSTNKKYVVGRGFVDSLTSIFNSIKPSLKGIGSYLSTNKDQILKPLLGAVGTLGAKALTEGLPALITKIANRNKNKILSERPPPPDVDLKILDDPVYKKIIQNMQSNMSNETMMPVSNIIGSGHKKRGSGIKKF